MKFGLLIYAPPPQKKKQQKNNNKNRDLKPGCFALFCVVLAAIGSDLCCGEAQNGVFFFSFKLNLPLKVKFN